MEKSASLREFNPMYVFTKYFKPHPINRANLNSNNEKEMDDFKRTYFELKIDQIMEEFPNYFTKKFRRERIKRDISRSLVRRMGEDQEEKKS
ncbi:MAG: hypothetical protein WD876_03520 [Candidatus Pacearchaeota archaeon]